MTGGWDYPAWDHPEVRKLITLALAEDIGSGDITTETCIPASRKATGRNVAQQDAVLAGVELLPLIFRMRGEMRPEIPGTEIPGGVERIDLIRSSGDVVSPGVVVTEVRGHARELLECERVSLNFLQRLSGVATLARRFAESVAHTRCRILDTRKTTPGLRRLEKLAAAAGGITNHRMGLWDAVLIKNNHIAAAGGVRLALERFASTKLAVEIEVRTRAELDEALDCGAKHLLLDNLTPDEARLWIEHIAGRASVELSGNITLDTVAAYAETGANFVSSGAITHQARSVNFNFGITLDQPE